jgi:hypothetical protein
VPPPSCTARARNRGHGKGNRVGFVLPDILSGEYAENEIRKDFTASERVAILETINTQSHGGNRKTDQEQNIAVDKAAKKAGL